MSNEHEHFIPPVKLYVITFAALLVLTVITVAAAQVNFGSMNTVIAMVIAFIKASVVGLFFMGLKWDKKINAIFFVGSLLFLAVFLGITSLDLFYRDQTDPIEGSRFGFKTPVKLINHHPAAVVSTSNAAVKDASPTGNTIATANVKNKVQVSKKK
jgi:caa(3)-type oxidase subunit IV